MDLVELLKRPEGKTVENRSGRVRGVAEPLDLEERIRTSSAIESHPDS